VYYPTSYAYGYGPWGYRGSYFGHSYWYSPFAYSYRPGYGYGYGYSGYYDYRHHYGYPAYGSAGGYYADQQDSGDVRQPAGSIRFRVSPNHARVYIDGALAGTVDDFDGLSGHLRLSPGSHTYELRAEGYRTHVGVLTVVTGQTRTERVNLQKQ
jgi:hypothetical protein